MTLDKVKVTINIERKQSHTGHVCTSRLHVSASPNVAIIRLYTELQKGNYLHRSCERDLALTKDNKYIKHIFVGVYL